MKDVVIFLDWIYRNKLYGIAEGIDYTKALSDRLKSLIVNNDDVIDFLDIHSIYQGDHSCFAGQFEFSKILSERLSNIDNVLYLLEKLYSIKNDFYSKKFCGMIYWDINKLVNSSASFILLAQAIDKLDYQKLHSGTSVRKIMIELGKDKFTSLIKNADDLSAILAICDRESCLCIPTPPEQRFQSQSNADSDFSRTLIPLLAEH